MKDIYEPEFVKKLFNQMSGSYERMNYITSFGFSIRWRKQFIQKIPQTQRDIKVIDLLSGLGENWNHLLKQFPDAQFYALDFSEAMVTKSSAKNAKLKNRFEISQQNLLKYKTDSDAFDVVTCAFGLKTFNEEQLESIARIIHCILKENGRFSFIEVSKPENKFIYYLYRIYLGKMIPVLGKLFLGNPENYKMLWVYTEKFGNCKKVTEIFERNHLKVNYESYFYGCATGISGMKVE